jgi:two-component sensor histidine kinase
MQIVQLISLLRKYQGAPAGYFIAFLVFAFAIGVRELVNPYTQIPYVTLFPAMVVCSLTGGRMAGILCAIVGGLVAWYFWLPPRHTFVLLWPSGYLTVLLYVITSTILLLLTRGLNETLRALERERDLSAELFRELQHRTANNLQNVSALLRQNRRAIEADPSRAGSVIEAAERRFEVMSRINRRLYDPEMQKVEMTSYLEGLCLEILDAVGNKNVTVTVRPSAIVLGRDQAMLVSLLLAELVMNAHKHAFQAGTPGLITVALERVGTNYRLLFTDDGKGLPEGHDFATAAGLGSRIILGLVNQLNGKLRTISGQGGARIEITMGADDGPLPGVPA